MTVHRFVVNVPNPRATASTVDLSLEPATDELVRGLGVEMPKGRLELTRTEITRDPCGERGKPKVRFRVPAQGSVDVTALIETAGIGSVGVHLVDRRAGKVAGGVLLVCVEPALVEGSGSLVTTHTPCPLVTDDAYVATAENPAKRLRATLGAGEQLLVVPIRNPSADPVLDALAYLEHLGPVDATFTPVTWNLGAMEPGSVFLAYWTLQVSAGTATVIPTVVLGGSKFDPVRNAQRLRVSPGRRRLGDEGDAASSY